MKMGSSSTTWHECNAPFILLCILYSTLLLQYCICMLLLNEVDAASFVASTAADSYTATVNPNNRATLLDRLRYSTLPSSSPSDEEEVENVASNINSTPSNRPQVVDNLAFATDVLGVLSEAPLRALSQPHNGNVSENIANLLHALKSIELIGLMAQHHRHRHNTSSSLSIREARQFDPGMIKMLLPLALPMITKMFGGGGGNSQDAAESALDFSGLGGLVGGGGGGRNAPQLPGGMTRNNGAEIAAGQAPVQIPGIAGMLGAVNGGAQLQQFAPVAAYNNMVVQQQRQQQNVPYGSGNNDDEQEQMNDDGSMANAGQRQHVFATGYGSDVDQMLGLPASDNNNNNRNRPPVGSSVNAGHNRRNRRNPNAPKAAFGNDNNDREPKACSVNGHKGICLAPSLEGVCRLYSYHTQSGGCIQFDTMTTGSCCYKPPPPAQDDVVLERQKQQKMSAADRGDSSSSAALPSNLVGVAANPAIQQLLRQRGGQQQTLEDLLAAAGSSGVNALGASSAGTPVDSKSTDILGMIKPGHPGGSLASLLADAVSPQPAANGAALPPSNGDALQSLLNSALASSNNNNNGLSVQQKRNQLASLLGGVAQTAGDASAAPDAFSGLLSSLTGGEGGGSKNGGGNALGSLLSSPAVGGLLSQLSAGKPASGGVGALGPLLSSPALLKMMGQLSGGSGNGNGGGNNPLGMLSGLLGGKKKQQNPDNPLAALFGGNNAAAAAQQPPDLSAIISGLSTAAQGDNAAAIMPLQELMKTFKREAANEKKKKIKTEAFDIGQFLKLHQPQAAVAEEDAEPKKNRKNHQLDPAVLSQMLASVMGQIKETSSRIDADGGNSAAVIKAFTTGSGANAADKQKLNAAMDALFAPGSQSQEKVMSMLTGMLGSGTRTKRQSSESESSEEERCTFKNFVGVCMANSLQKLCISMEMNIAQPNACSQADEQFCCYSSVQQQPAASTAASSAPANSATASITVNIQPISPTAPTLSAAENKPSASITVTTSQGNNKKSTTNNAAIDGALDDIISQLFSSGLLDAGLPRSGVNKKKFNGSKKTAPTPTTTTTEAPVTDALEVETTPDPTSTPLPVKRKRQKPTATTSAPSTTPKPKPKGGGIFGSLMGGAGGIGKMLSDPNTMGMIQQFMPLIMSTMGGDPKIAQQFAQFLPMVSSGGPTNENVGPLISGLMTQSVGGKADGGGGSPLTAMLPMLLGAMGGGAGGGAAAGGGGGGGGSPLTALMPMLMGAMGGGGGGAGGGASPLAALMPMLAGALGGAGKGGAKGGGNDPSAALAGLLGGLGGAGKAGGGGAGNLAGMLAGLGGGGGGGGKLPAGLAGLLGGAGSERVPSIAPLQQLQAGGGGQQPADISRLNFAGSGGTSQPPPLLASGSENAAISTISNAQCGGPGESGMCVTDSYADQCQRVGYQVRASGCRASNVCCYQSTDVAASFKLENAESCAVNGFQGMCVPERQAQQCPQYNLEVAMYGCSRADLHCCYTRNVQKGVCGSAGRAASGQPGDMTVPEAPRLSTNIDFIEPGEFCWHAALLERYTGYYFCGAALIDPQWVITAAHCVQDRAPSEITIRLGEWDFNLTSEIPGPRDYAVHNMYFHSNFNTRTLENDVVLLKLAQPVDTTLPNICVACRPGQVDFTHKICVAAGWGHGDRSGPVDYSPRLKRIPARVWPDFECEARLRTAPGLGPTFKLPTASFVCASAVGRQRVCRGDGGGGLVCNVGGYYQLAGLVVSGFGCDSKHGFPALFVDLQQYQSWIDDVMRNNENKS